MSVSFSVWLLAQNRKKICSSCEREKCPPTDRLKKKRGKVLEQRFTVPLYEHRGCCSINPLSLCFYWEIWSQQTDGGWGGATLQIRLPSLWFCVVWAHAGASYLQNLHRSRRCDDARGWETLTHVVVSNHSWSWSFPTDLWAPTARVSVSTSGLWSGDWDIFIMITSIEWEEKKQHRAL